MALACLEGAEHGIAFSSGLGATTTLMHLVDPGERVVLIADVYGGVYRMTSQVYEPKGYRFSYVPGRGVRRQPRLPPRRRHPACLGRDAVEPAAQRRRHPPRRRCGACRRCAARRRQHLRLAVPAAAARARRRRRRALDDEVPRRPLRRDRRLRRHERRRRSRSGSASCRSRSAPCPGPFDCLARAARDQDARRADAPALRERARGRGASSSSTRASSACSTPACRATPATTSRARQMRDFGGMVSFLVESEEEAVALAGATKLFQLAESLGGVESLIEHPGADDARLDRRRAVRGAAQPAPPLGRDRVGDLLADLESALAP